MLQCWPLTCSCVVSGVYTLSNSNTFLLPWAVVHTTRSSPSNLSAHGCLLSWRQRQNTRILPRSSWIYEQNDMWAINHTKKFLWTTIHIWYVGNKASQCLYRYTSIVMHKCREVASYPGSFPADKEGEELGYEATGKWVACFYIL